MASHLFKKRLILGIVIAIGMVIAIVGSTAGSSLSAATTTTKFSYTVKDLGTLGGNYSDANDINNAAKVVGVANTSSEFSHAVLWDKGNKIDLGTLGGSSSAAIAINKTGQVVGRSKTDSQVTHAFLWEKGSIKDLNNLIPPKSGWVLIWANNISDRGQIVGYGRINNQTHAFLLRPFRAR